ncbi:2-oxoadipate dioxygenase/decarboxylase family protein [Glaciimonas sp. GNP009]
MESSAVFQLLSYIIDEGDAKDVLNHVYVIPTLTNRPALGTVDRASIAQTLALVLFHDLLRRVPAAKRYVYEFKSEDTKIVLDHGAARTVLIDGIDGFPSGEAALTRLLIPLGYQLNGEYPLPRLKMMGRSYAHQDFPEDIPQFFISEIFTDQLSDECQQAVYRTIATSRDPVTSALQGTLDRLERDMSLPFHDAANVVLGIAACFGRQHELPCIEDYRTIVAESAEMGWITTEGNAFNHATARVGNLYELHASLKAAGFSIKPEVEVSKNGRVRQTAFLADSVSRRFKGAVSSFEQIDVPGSFYEFIERDQIVHGDGDEKLDLSFDSNNATAIFKMTA